MVSKKYALFFVGEANSGKSTLIRSLTGSGKKKIYKVRTLDGEIFRAFVCDSSPQEMFGTYPSSTFIKKLETENGVKREAYDIFIGALQLTLRNSPNVGYKRYISGAKGEGFDVRLAVIKEFWKVKDSYNTKKVDTIKIEGIDQFAKENHIPIFFANATNDPNVESSKIRKKLYP